MSLWETARFGELSAEFADVGLPEDGASNVDEEPQSQPQRQSVEPDTGETACSSGDQTGDDIHSERLIMNKDASYPGQFSPFFGCSWVTGQVYSFSEDQDSSPVEIPPSPLCSPTTRMKQQVNVGMENMQSTYQVLSTFEDPSGKGTTLNGTAVALSKHYLITAAHTLILVTPGENGNMISWVLKDVRILAADYVCQGKIRRFGYPCTVQGKPASAWGTKSECPPTGSDIAILRVQQELPIFVLPCSPRLSMTLTMFGYPGALEYLKTATRELRREGEGSGKVWSKYWSLLWDRIQVWSVDYEGDIGKAVKKAKQWLLEQFQTVLRGISEGVQTVSAGFVEAITPAYVAHTCPTLPGLSGGLISPLEVPGYIVADHSGALEINQNIGTSTDNIEFVTQYMRYVLPDLPTPDWLLYKRPYFTLDPFLTWLRLHRAHIPPCSVWAHHIAGELEERVERPSKKRKLADS